MAKKIADMTLSDLEDFSGDMLKRAKKTQEIIDGRYAPTYDLVENDGSGDLDSLLVDYDHPSFNRSLDRAYGSFDDRGALDKWWNNDVDAHRGLIDEIDDALMNLATSKSEVNSLNTIKGQIEQAYRELKTTITEDETHMKRLAETHVDAISALNTRIPLQKDVAQARLGIHNALIDWNRLGTDSEFVFTARDESIQDFVDKFTNAIHTKTPLSAPLTYDSAVKLLADRNAAAAAQNAMQNAPAPTGTPPAQTGATGGGASSAPTPSGQPSTNSAPAPSTSGSPTNPANGSAPVIGSTTGGAGGSPSAPAKTENEKNLIKEINAYITNMGITQSSAKKVFDGTESAIKELKAHKLDLETQATEGLTNGTLTASKAQILRDRADSMDPNMKALTDNETELKALATAQQDRLDDAKEEAKDLNSKSEAELEQIRDTVRDIALKAGKDHKRVAEIQKDNKIYMEGTSETATALSQSFKANEKIRDAFGEHSVLSQLITPNGPNGQSALGALGAKGMATVNSLTAGWQQMKDEAKTQDERNMLNMIETGGLALVAIWGLNRINDIAFDGKMPPALKWTIFAGICLHLLKRSGDIGAEMANNGHDSAWKELPPVTQTNVTSGATPSLGQINATSAAHASGTTVPSLADLVAENDPEMTISKDKNGQIIFSQPTDGQLPFVAGYDTDEAKNKLFQTCVAQGSGSAALEHVKAFDTLRLTGKDGQPDLVAIRYKDGFACNDVLNNGAAPYLAQTAGGI